MKALALLVLLFLWPGSHGGFTQHDLSGVRAAPSAGARAPLSTRFVDQFGRPTTLGRALAGRPGVLVFADYTCTYLCGPGLVLTSEALAGTHLRPDRDYSFVVVGINPRDGPVQARAMGGRMHDAPGRAAVLLSGGRADLVAAALGYHYIYDPQLRQYAHDTSIYILAPDGRVAALLPQFELTAVKLTNAIAHAPSPPTAALPTPLRFICSCLQPLTGAFDQPSVLLLRVGGVAFLAAGGLGLVMLVRRRERRP